MSEINYISFVSCILCCTILLYTNHNFDQNNSLDGGFLFFYFFNRYHQIVLVERVLCHTRQKIQTARQWGGNFRGTLLVFVVLW